MLNPENEIGKIKDELIGLQNILGNVNSDNFDEYNLKIQNSVSAVVNINNKLKTEFPETLYKKYTEEIKEPAKFILKMLDSMIKVKKNEMAEVSKQLKVFENKKKLTKYIR